MTAGQPGDRPAALRAAIEELRIEVGHAELLADEFTTELLLLVVAVEELLYAPWWRRTAVRRRWRRDVRESIRHIQGVTFTDKRTHTIASGWVTRPGSGNEVRMRWTPGGRARDAG